MPSLLNGINGKACRKARKVWPSFDLWNCRFEQLLFLADQQSGQYEVSSSRD